MREFTLGYTIDDDGVWIYCDCGARQCLTISATLDDANDWAIEHQAEHWRAEFPLRLLGMMAATTLVMAHPEAVSRILRESTEDLRQRLDQIVADLRATDKERPAEAAQERQEPWTGRRVRDDPQA